MSENVALFSVRSIQLRVRAMRTRFPFRYGIASLEALPHLFVHAEIELDGEVHNGIASDGLPPKWFNKDPDSSVEQDLATMIAVIQNSARIAPLLTSQPRSFFAWWQDLFHEVTHWCEQHEHPLLLAQFGASLIERAVLDALCKAHQESLHKLLKAPTLGIDFGCIDDRLADLTVADILPVSPLDKVSVRHTVGLADPLCGNDISEADRLKDGLPQALDEVIQQYDVQYFKIKLSGQDFTDFNRLDAISSILRELRPAGYKVTLDGNENFKSIADFRRFYEALVSRESLSDLMAHVLWVEQPLHRECALLSTVKGELESWENAPRLIIDESDAGLDAVPKALGLGYQGVSHKNCKGILKGLINLAYLKIHETDTGSSLILSGEDLANVGPVALCQDLAMQALLGVSHVERNGHHYFNGLSVHLPEIAEAALAAHPDLFVRAIDGGIITQIRAGEMAIDSVNSAPFGCGVMIAPDKHPTLKEWILQGGFSEVT